MRQQKRPITIYSFIPGVCVAMIAIAACSHFVATRSKPKTRVTPAPNETRPASDYLVTAELIVKPSPGRVRILATGRDLVVTFTNEFTHETRTISSTDWAKRELAKPFDERSSQPVETK